MKLKITLAVAVTVAALLWFLNEDKEKSSQKAEDDCSGDRFCSFEELTAVYEEGKDWVIATSTEGNQQWLVSAIHGGGIEETTSTLAEAIAGDDYPYYAFKGRLASNNFRNLHITSTNFDEPQALEMVAKANHHISIHGAGGDEPKTLIGGRDQELMGIVKHHLEEEGFAVEEAPEHLDGDHPDNYVNKTKTKKGVQLEITRAQRKAFFKNGDIRYSSRKDAANKTEAFTSYVEAIQKAMKEYRD
ncbi:poly-gamma-glutamate hydrolase family protein [Halobacillus sp. Nhm2S1]|uniref:poly-gamma-glutamate hydrolase family protein n=1 Tax=Halobacillus sp. Nhm2S1 TaxID=2866716 RepID=UPI001C736C44|nr:poly-gamma-glutamate hydrolase family protein [Halobacillus sp. Nhm2S1]MBX0356712.1 poly-gamma-glutamate hydrolase family protein [Halobacillus sp. Nhm2S1]